MAMIPTPEELGDIVEAVTAFLRDDDAASAVRHLQRLHVADAAIAVAEIQDDLTPSLITAMPNDLLASVLEQLDVETASEAVMVLNPDRRARVLDRVAPEIATDLLHGIDWDEAQRTLARMSDLETIGDLLIHADDDAGGLMSPDFASVRDYWTARTALRVLSESNLSPEDMREIYVVDAQGALVGHLELSELVFAPLNANLREIMRTDVISISATDDQEDAVQLAGRYDLLSLPVVNSNNQLEGVIAINDLFEVAEREATEDMFRMFGVSGGLRSPLSLRISIRNRLPWLVLNLFTLMVTGFVLSLFKPTLDTLTLLAVFLPVVMGQAGIAGTQTVTIIVRSIALDELTLTSVPRLLWFEVILSVAQGVVITLILGLAVYLWQGDAALVLVVMGALLLNLVVAALSGVLVPMALRQVGIDPAMASAVIVTTATDILGVVMYLGLASIFIGFLA